MKKSKYAARPLKQEIHANQIQESEKQEDTDANAKQDDHLGLVNFKEEPKEEPLQEEHKLSADCYTGIECFP